MKFALVNMLRDPSQVPATTLLQIADSLERQLVEHVAPFWEMSQSTVDVATGNDPTIVPVDTVPVCLLDDADQAGELGVHDFENGRPVGKAYWGPLLANGGTLISGPLSLSVTLSHEIIEVAVDPYASFWCDRGGDLAELVALEACDPVEDQAYAVDGVWVSDFAGPRWFRQGDGPFSWLKSVTAPFMITPGGYVITEAIAVTGPGSDGKTGLRQKTAKRVRIVTFGPKMPEWKKAQKKAKARTRARGVLYVSATHGQPAGFASGR